MGAHVELISDDEGLTILGAPKDVNGFLRSAELDQAPSRSMDMQRLRRIVGSVGAATQISADVSANSGRWVKLTAESAKAIKKYGLTPTDTPGIHHAMAGQRGDIKQWIQIAQAPSALLAGPMALSALSTMMQQRAMQEQMDAIVDYLQVIDAKIDDILRGQRDAIMARLRSAARAVNEAWTVREEVGHVDGVTWDIVQSAGTTIDEAHEYVLLQLSDIATKLAERKSLKASGKSMRESEPHVREWLSVLAYTVQLHDEFSILKLDRVLATEPESIDRHRTALSRIRRTRLAELEQFTSEFLMQLEDTGNHANSKVLLNPFDAPTAVQASTNIGVAVVAFREGLGLSDHQSLVASRPWKQAAIEFRDKTVSVTSETLGRAAQRFRSSGPVGDADGETPHAFQAIADAGSTVRDAATGIGDGVSTLLGRKPKDRKTKKHRVEMDNPSDKS